MRSDFSLNTVFLIRQIKTKQMQSPDSNWVQCRAHQDLPPTRGKSARYAREFSFARCHDEAAAIILMLLVASVAQRYHVTSDTLGREFDPGKRDSSH